MLAQPITQLAISISTLNPTNNINFKTDNITISQIGPHLEVHINHESIPATLSYNIINPSCTLHQQPLTQAYTPKPSHSPPLASLLPFHSIVQIHLPHGSIKHIIVQCDHTLSELEFSLSDHTRTSSTSFCLLYQGSPCLHNHTPLLSLTGPISVRAILSPLRPCISSSSIITIPLLFDLITTQALAQGIYRHNCTHTPASGCPEITPNLIFATTLIGLILLSIFAGFHISHRLHSNQHRQTQTSPQDSSHLSPLPNRHNQPKQQLSEQIRRVILATIDPLHNPSLPRSSHLTISLYGYTGTTINVPFSSNVIELSLITSLLAAKRILTTQPIHIGGDNWYVKASLLTRQREGSSAAE